MKEIEFGSLMQSYVAELFNKRWTPLFPLEDARLPPYSGVYLLAYQSGNLKGKRVTSQTVFYVGMTNKIDGIQGRLKQFKSAVAGKGGHSGGNRFYRDIAGRNPDHSFYVAWIDFKCERRKGLRTPCDLQVMGTVAGLELYVMAYILDREKKEPELNKK